MVCWRRSIWRAYAGHVSATVAREESGVALRWRGRGDGRWAGGLGWRGGGMPAGWVGVGLSGVGFAVGWAWVEREGGRVWC